MRPGWGNTVPIPDKFDKSIASVASLAGNAGRVLVKISGDKDIYFDARWVGAHGIGRFASEVLARSDRLKPVYGWIAPSSPVDFLYTTLRLLPRRGRLWFSPGYNVPICGLARYVFTLHDLTHLDAGATGGFAKKLYYRIVLRPASRRAAKVLTVSEYSRERIVQWAGVTSDRVVNVGNGVDAAFSPEGEKYEPGFAYFLCVSNRKPHKNEVRLLQAFAKANIPSEVRLLFTGRETDELSSLLAELGLGGRVSFLGKMPDSALCSCYRGALGLLFPSLSEGFGLPVVEAMACGTPVVTSNTTSLPEVAGDAALLVNPLSVGEITSGIERLWSDEILRSSLINKGFKQATKYRWDHVVAKIEAVFNELEWEQGR